MNGYVNLVGLVVAGEWNLPDNCRGGVSVCLIDKRMKRASEATLGSYTCKAARKSFSFKLIPNYSVTSQDAERRPWEVMVNIKGVEMQEGWCPLSLEFVSVCIVTKNIIRKGLREKLINVSEDASIELTEEVVDEFFESVPMAKRLTYFRNKKKRGLFKRSFVSVSPIATPFLLRFPAFSKLSRHLFKHCKHRDNFSIHKIFSKKFSPRRAFSKIPFTFLPLIGVSLTLSSSIFPNLLS